MQDKAVIEAVDRIPNVNCNSLRRHPQMIDIHSWIAARVIENLVDGLGNDMDVLKPVTTVTQTHNIAQDKAVGGYADCSVVGG